MSNAKDKMVSTSGKRMLHGVSPIYDDSNIACMIFDAFGDEFDAAKEDAQSLHDQFYLMRAGWTLPEWADEYGVDLIEDATTSDKRKTIQSRRNKVSPPNPYNISKYAKGYTGCDLNIIENTGPNAFAVEIMFDDDATIDYQKIEKFLNRYTPAHLTHSLYERQNTSLFIGAALIAETRLEVRPIA